LSVPDTVPSLNHPNKRKNGARWGPRWRDSLFFCALPRA